jgi:hypothetical protein
MTAKDTIPVLCDAVPILEETDAGQRYSVLSRRDTNFGALGTCASLFFAVFQSRIASYMQEPQAFDVVRWTWDLDGQQQVNCDQMQRLFRDQNLK